MDHVFHNLSFGERRNDLYTYADDIVIFADAEKEMKVRIAEFTRVITALGMTVNPTKTKVMDGHTPGKWSLSGQVKTYLRRHIGLRDGVDTLLFQGGHENSGSV